MKVLCAPLDWDFDAGPAADLEVVLFSQADRPERGTAGSNILEPVAKPDLNPHPRSWDLLSFALSVIAADLSVRRDESPDGWTREISLEVAVSDPGFWSGQCSLLEQQLRFLTTDLWTVTFTDGGIKPAPPDKPALPEEDCVSLLSGGLDSLIGALDLVAEGQEQPYLVSQVARGDKQKQRRFAAQIGGGLNHLQLNHNANSPGENEHSQRSRSIIFLAYGVLLATALGRYHEGDEVPLYVPENGFIAINPPLTSGRLGSLSTRTAHPIFLRLFQRLLDHAGLHVRVETPYRFRTKGEMLSRCAEQPFLEQHAHTTTSCARYARSPYQHCGRCVPCLIRRGAFHAWGQPDKTTYVYDDISRDDKDHARFDDVRSAAMAVAQVRADGLDRWLTSSLNSTQMGDTAPYRDVARRGIEELGAFLDAEGVL